MVEAERRSVRRHHAGRLKKSRRHYWGGISGDPGRAGVVVNTPTPCSCYMCGNPRKYFNEKTVQERRLFQDKGEL